ncbi:tumor necrosis factor receptor superfamily member 6B-like [Synchiropus splendidus]|uniref:tumor necrosis factor receptor superfamily member 6B-like n=1 Tax=Synchiropus splendidus TaxID=270530 RepID=UPI00237D3408|nr:tumor necrosis factor receptor superfamily member 6B-like [Synchiropus splendidus]
MSPSVLLLLVICLSAVRAEPSTPNRTYSVLDRNTNTLLECDGCPPGTYLVSRCTATQATRCSPCPAGSFTELWNTIRECLRCHTCGWNQAVKAECRADSDRQCQCQPGHYLDENMDTCLPHSKCPTGEGVLHQGTLVADTVCQPCADGTFSDRNSAEQECVTHRRCESSAGHKRLLPGTTWHDSICVKCDGDRAQEAAEHLRGILPVFFTHHRIPRRLLRRIFHKMKNGQTENGSANLSRSRLQDKLNAWLSTATATQLEQLRAILLDAGTRTTGERLRTKLQNVERNLKSVCEQAASENEIKD